MREKKAKAQVFNIEAGTSFVDVFVAGVRARFGHDPAVLTKTVILLPNRRAVRAVHEAFLRASDGRASLLPRLRAIGDVEEEELHFEATIADVLDDDLPAPIEALERQLTLARLIAAWHRRTGREPALIPAEATRMAQSLARLIDQVETEKLVWAQLKDLAPERFSSHWQETLEFLTIVTQAWPEILDERGRIDPAKRRNLLLDLQAKTWAESPPDFPVIAAGSTGSLPATRALMRVIAELEQGALVLPGLDQKMPDAHWEDLTPSHPQYGLKHLLEDLSVPREDVQAWHPDVQDDALRIKRLAHARLALHVGAWSEIPQEDAPLPGLALMEAPGEREEATAIALMMREALEIPEQTAALVTSDQRLARRVASALERWGITVDNSAGTPLHRMPAGRYLRLVADAVGQRLAPAPLLALLKHPFTCAGQDKREFHAWVRQLEISTLRGVRPAPGIDGLIKAIGDDTLKKWFASLAEHFRAFEILISAKAASFHDLVEAHITCAEALCTAQDQDGAERLWANPDGEGAAQFIADLLSAAPALGMVEGQAYSALFSSLLEAEVVRTPIGRHPRLAIWGTIEARLQAADIMILGGLNEGSWPSPPSPDPWMSEPMRVEFGLPSAERKVGLAAHDFIQGIGARHVILSRAEKQDGTPTVASRWVTALKTLFADKIERVDHYLQWAAQLDEAKAEPAIMPQPRPPKSARPRQASVTQIESWRRDPYGHYARDILKLRPLDPIDQDPGAIERGVIIHDILDRFLKEKGKTLDTLLQMGREAFQPFDDRPAVWGFWWPRFERIAAWFVEEQRKRAVEGAKVLATEIKARWQVSGTDEPFTLVAKADRIDQSAQGGLEIIDYKTGAIPSNKRVEAGYAPQLPLEAVMANHGAFDGISKSDVDKLTYWRMGGGEIPAEIRHIPAADQRMKEAHAGLIKHINVFAKESTPFLPSPRPEFAGYGDYDHLARIKEWRGPLDGEDGA